MRNLKGEPLIRRKARTASSTFAIGGVSCSADSFVVTESSVFRKNICTEKPAHRKSAKRYTQYCDDSSDLNICYN